MQYPDARIEVKDLGTIDGFSIIGSLEYDHGSTPYDADCYSEEDIDAWKTDEWCYVGLLVTASIDGIELGTDSIWGNEYGFFIDHSKTDGSTIFISPYDDGGYLPDLIDGAIHDARSNLERMVTLAASIGVG